MKLHLRQVMLFIFILNILTACSSDKELKNQTAEKTEGQSIIDGTITALVGHGAGGQTDLVSRAIAPLAERELGQSIVVTNKPGANGAIATKEVLDQKPDGRTILFSAENPAVYEVLGISKDGFDDLYPINLFSTVLTAVIVPNDSKYQTMEDLIADAKANPGKVKLGSSGPGGMEFALSTMIANETNTKFNLIPFDGGGPIVTAVIGNHLDASIAGMASAIENVKAGKIRILAINNTERVDTLDGIPAITESIPGMDKYLPWGPFYGVWVHKDTPDNVKLELKNAFERAQQDPEFQDFLNRTNGESLGISGEEAEEYWKNWQSTTAWLLHDAGETEVSPADLGIPRKE